MAKPKISDDPNKVGWNIETQNLLCLIMLDDNLADALTKGKAGEAFFRAFVVEDKKTGEIGCGLRFRYKDGDQWYRVNPKKPDLGREERIEELAGGVENVLRTGLALFSGGFAPPKESVLRFYPPHPEDSRATLDWLMLEGLINRMVMET